VKNGRDIKSENICLTASLQPKLVDFGFVMLAPHQGTITPRSPLKHLVSRQTQVRGTPVYCCPCYKSRSIDYAACCDVFSFGVVMLEVLTGTLQAGKGGVAIVPDITSRYRGESLKLITEFDPTIRDAWSTEIAGALAGMSLECTLPDSGLRPTTDEITNELLRISGSLEVRTTEVGAIPPSKCHLCARAVNEGQRCSSRISHTFCQPCMWYYYGTVDSAYPDWPPCPIPGCRGLGLVPSHLRREGFEQLPACFAQLMQLCGNADLWCPRLIYIEPDVQNVHWRSSIFEGPISVYFVCAVSFRRCGPVLRLASCDSHWIIHMDPVIRMCSRILRIAENIGKAGDMDIQSFLQFSQELSIVSDAAVRATGTPINTKWAYKTLVTWAMDPTRASLAWLHAFQLVQDAWGNGVYALPW
jgi:Protein kinase domain